MDDTYKTISQPSEETLYKEKGSKFFGYAFPVTSEDEVKQYLEVLRKQHTGAVHFCYAFQIGTEKIYYRANDDGEPSNSAGMPIYGQIQSFGVTNVLVVSVRFFGGVKLGVGGLISAYRTSAQMALEASEILEKTIDLQYKVTFEYKDINKVMRILREKNLQLVSQRMELDCEVVFAVRKKNAPEAMGAFEAVYGISIVEIG
ncbi:YigZ family protein [Flavobacterium sp. MAH-1]|uniref:YigZ family protein n=1 Tax=Flavobacterium agri TaxID=2743471 RepID=A0A7Y8Y6D0_9FLAO|nr:YigZ family protein [Flavobacterium agri]NUY82086.1 YigZ family protein [Flavobacterium agri]NYA72110.1 YigZ family protein [Flavobacterium agri]